jgi:MoaA/NifB/PqqE/SkfB family radical SAM enzyme
MTAFENLKQDILKNENFCFYPFLEISTRPNGVVFPCCYWNDHEHLSKLEKISHESSILDLWNSARIVTIRNALAAGQRLSGCNICYRDGSASMRVRGIKESINNDLHLELVKNTIDNNGIAAHLPRRLELKPNNLCNLKCISCNAYDSSQIEDELKQLDEKHGGIKTHGGRYRHKVVDVLNKTAPGVWEGVIGEYVLPDQRNLSWAESEKFWQDMMVVLPKIEVLSFAGGEPTLNPIVHKILSYCVENGYDKNIIVFLSSNFTNLKDDFFKLMKGFKRFELIASIDGIDKVQEYLRFPSKWSTIKRNFELAKTHMQSNNTKLVTNITVSILNIFYIRQLLDYIDSTDRIEPKYHQWPYNINLLNMPFELQINWIPNELRKTIIADLEDYKHTSAVLRRFPGLKMKIDLLLTELEKPVDPILANKQLRILYETITTLDENRKMNYKQCIPFLSEIFENEGIS